MRRYIEPSELSKFSENPGDALVVYVPEEKACHFFLHLEDDSFIQVLYRRLHKNPITVRKTDSTFILQEDGTLAPYENTEIMVQV